MSTTKKSQRIANDMCQEALRDTLMKLRDAKPDERGELARRYAVTITELEKALAYFEFFVMPWDQ